MRTFLRWALRIGALLIALVMVSTLTAGLVWPEFFDSLPEPLLGLFRASTTSDLVMHPVFGNITFDGEPIAEGEIRFVPLNKSLNPDIAQIKKGKYVAQVKDGEHRVEIRAENEERQYIPARYNVDSDLRFQAKDGEHNFDLHGPGK